MEAILRAGFHGGRRAHAGQAAGVVEQVTSTAVVKQVLVISAYKPDTASRNAFWPLLVAASTRPGTLRASTWSSCPSRRSTPRG